LQLNLRFRCRFATQIQPGLHTLERCTRRSALSLCRTTGEERFQLGKPIAYILLWYRHHRLPYLRGA
jgi:hypothetical protein